MAGEADHDTLVLQLLEFVPNATPEQATQYLSANDWDLDAAAASLMADAEEAEDDATTEAGPASSSAAPAGYTGPRTLDGRPAPGYSSSSASQASKKQPKKKGLATLSSLGGGGHGHDHDDDDSDDDDDDVNGPRDTYAGGEKSGLAVQDPNSTKSNAQRILDDLLAKARSQAPRPEASAAGPSAPASFRGAGQTLGGEGVESRTIPDPQSAAAAPGAAAGAGAASSNAAVQERTLHLWRDGFSIDDGPLRRFDDPENADALRMIQQGRAPVHLMNVRYDEPLDVKLQQHDENFKQLPKVYKPFGGEGRRLGSPVPGASSSAAVTPTTSAPAASVPSSSAATSSTAPSTNADTSQPTIMIRIQMPDGTRLPARFNTTQTVSDIYDFITQSSPDLRSGGWVLATTFPNKDHTDKSLVLGDMAEFKKGGTAMVKRST